MPIPMPAPPPRRADNCYFEHSSMSYGENIGMGTRVLDIVRQFYETEVGGGPESWCEQVLGFRTQG